MARAVDCWVPKGARRGLDARRDSRTEPATCPALNSVAMRSGFVDTTGVNQRQLLALLWAIPPLAVALVGWAWFAARSAGPQWTATVWVASTEADRVLLRTRVTSLRGRIAPHRPLAVSAEIQRDGETLRRLNGQTTDQGFADFDLRLPRATSEYALSFWIGEDELPLSWPIESSVPSPLRSVGTPLSVHLKPDGPVVTLALRHGALTVPVPDELQVTWAAEEGETLSLELEGAEGSGGERRFQVASGTWLRITPIEHVVEVTLKNAAGTGTGVGLLPLVPGANAARLEGESTLTVVSPVPRPEVHVAFATESRVLGFERVALRAAHGGISPGAPVFRGESALAPEVARALASEPVWAVTSSDPDFVSSGQLGWPLNGLAGNRTMHFSWSAVLDGSSQREVESSRRRRDWQVYAWSGLGVACVLVLGLVWILDRRSPSVDGLDSSRLVRDWLLVAVACVVLGFVALGALFGLW